jgi:aryl-alcohol dehydrogenase-like predicted oxidoreductase
MTGPMPRRSCGPFEVGAIGLGCMPMSWGYSVAEADDREIRATLHRAVEVGVTLLDTADVYGPYTNEELIGRNVVADGLRDAVQIATKVGLTPIDATTYGRDGTPKHVRAACDASLARLGVDVIDLYQLHRIDPDVPLEETWGAMAELVTAGKVRALGMSEVSVEEIERAGAVYPVATVQCEVSIWTRDNIDNGVVGHCGDRGIGILAYSPLGRGFLTGALTVDQIGEGDFRSANPRFTPEAMAANEAIVDGVAGIARRHGVTAAQIALAWVLAQGKHVIPIPGTKRRRWLEENAEAIDVVLTAVDLAEIDALPPSVAPRY